MFAMSQIRRPSPSKLKTTTKSTNLKCRISPRQCRVFIFVTLTIIFVYIGISFLKRRRQASTTSNSKCDELHHCQIIPQCSCRRKFFHDLGQNRTRLDSTCSDEASHYNSNQKVISYAFHIPAELADSPIMAVFHAGSIENLKKMREFYPGYVMRLYTDLNLEGKYCKLVCENTDLHWCDIRKTPSHGDLSHMYFMTWRFLPMGDETIDIFHSRDLDSLISAREAAAVSDWLENYPNKSIQVMRDNWHHNYLILGGMWGARNQQIGRRTSIQLQSSIISLSSAEIHGITDKKKLDQVVLAKILFSPMYLRKIIAYDSYHCDKWSEHMKTLVRPFPVQRLNSKTDFVGNTGLGGQEHEMEPCPIECRPDHGKHWTYC